MRQSVETLSHLLFFTAESYKMRNIFHFLLNTYKIYGIMGY